jgi:hypothetical protein
MGGFAGHELFLPQAKSLASIFPYRQNHPAGGSPAETWWLHRSTGEKCAELGATAPPL